MTTFILGIILLLLALTIGGGLTLFAAAACTPGGV